MISLVMANEKEKAQILKSEWK